MILKYEDFLNESKREKLNLDNYSYAFHWLNGGYLFDQIYDIDSPSSRNYIMSAMFDEELKFPNKLPNKKYVLGGDDGYGVCMTLNPNYLYAGDKEESNICLIMDFKKILKKFNVTNLTDNGETEIRVKKIPNWPSYCVNILMSNITFEEGEDWEDFIYRPVKSWFPSDLNDKLKIINGESAQRSYLKNLQTI